jgi:polyisoprenoid-binding protein YceI
MLGILALGLSGCQNPADEVTPAKVSDARPAAPQPTATAPGTQPADAGKVSAASGNPGKNVTGELPSNAEVLTINGETSKIEFVGSKVTGSHSGGFKTFKGTWALVPGKPEASRISAEIAMDSTWTDNGQLTGHLKSPDFFDVSKFPTTSFETTAIRAGNDSPKAKDATHTITGNLTLHGVTQSIEIPARLTVAADSATLQSEFSLNRKNFGINYPGKANDLIRDEVVIKLDIRASRKS